MCVFRPLQCVLNERRFFVGAARFPSVFLLILTVQSSFMLLPLASHALSITRDDSMSVRQGYSNGRFNSTKYLQMRRIDLDNDFNELSEILTSARSDNDYTAPVQKKKREKRIILGRRTEEGYLEELPPTQSMWYHQYTTCPQVNDTRFLRNSRLRFRLPYHSFLEFVDVASEGNWFPL